MTMYKIEKVSFPMNSCIQFSLNALSLLSISLSVFLVLSNGALAAACSKDSAGKITSSVACTTDTDLRILTFYEVGLCTTRPNAPSINTSFNSANVCKKLFENPVGTRVGISATGSTPLTGGKPQNVDYGTYGFSYFIFDARAGIKTVATFSSPRSTDGSSTGNIARETGSTCWTRSGDKFNWNPTAWSVTPSNIVCGNSVSGYDIAWTLQNSLASGSGVYSQSLNTIQGTYDVFLIKTDGTLASTSSDRDMGDVAKVLVLVPKGVTIDQYTSNVDLSFKVLDGTNVDQQRIGGVDYLYDLAGSGNIVIRLSAN